MGKSSTIDKLPLSQLIELVTEELRRAARQAQEREDPIMQFEECQLEIAVEVEMKIGGGINIYAFTLGGERTKTNSNTVTITFKRLEDRIYEFPEVQEGEGPVLER
jgi:hypothetical protein